MNESNVSFTQCLHLFIHDGIHNSKERYAMLKSLVRKIIDMFGFSRCTVACNRHVNAAVADGGGVQASWCQMQCVIRSIVPRSNWSGSLLVRQMCFIGLSTHDARNLSQSLRARADSWSLKEYLGICSSEFRLKSLRLYCYCYRQRSNFVRTPPNSLSIASYRGYYLCLYASSSCSFASLLQRTIPSQP